MMLEKLTFVAFSPRGIVGFAKYAANVGLLFKVVEKATNSFSTFSSMPAYK